MFTQSLQPVGQEDWATFVNCCGIITAFVIVFPEKTVEYKPIVKDVIKVVKDKTEMIRKNAAVLLARFA